jgi:hypothetical protein
MSRSLKSTIALVNATGTSCCSPSPSPSPSPSHIVTDGQSVCLSLCRAPSGTHEQMFVTVWEFVIGRVPSLTRCRVCRLSESVSSITSVVIMYIYLHFICLTWLQNIYIASVSPGSVEQIMPYFWQHPLLRQSSHLKGRMLDRRQV